MKKSVITTATILSIMVGSGAALAQENLSGTAEISVAGAHLTSPYQDATTQSFNVLLNGKNQDKYGLYATSLDAWGEKAQYYSLRWVAHLNENTWVDASLGGSDQGRITAKQRESAMLNFKLAQYSLILGAGLDHYVMRGDAEALSVKGQAVYYVPGVPLVVQANVGYSESRFNQKGGASYGLTATYGQTGQWTATASAATSRVHYELLTQPGTVADYPSSTYAVSGRVWIEPKWGLTVGASQVRNRYYERNELKGGVFWDF